MTDYWDSVPLVFKTPYTGVYLEKEKVGDLIRFYVVPNTLAEDQSLLSTDEQVDFNTVRFCLRLSAVHAGFSHIEDFSAGNFSYRDGYFPSFHLHVRLRSYRPEFNAKISKEIPRIRTPDFSIVGRNFYDITNGEKPFTDRSTEDRPLSQSHIIELQKEFEKRISYFYNNNLLYKEICKNSAKLGIKICEIAEIRNAQI